MDTHRGETVAAHHFRVAPAGSMGWRAAALLLLVAVAGHDAGAQVAAPAPAFDVAYRAWDVVTDIARHNRSPGLAGECAATFRPFVIPGLKRQTPQEQDVAATACVAAARSACADGRLQRTGAMAAACEEFRSPGPGAVSAPPAR
ncbi:MAG: hypothetical protein EOO24_25795 [Comamonadaceae bacterium]|nr:MAG: hypothetical protein EOO24_25795 [Comamonadaceae bacterium]